MVKIVNCGSDSSISKQFEYYFNKSWNIATCINQAIKFGAKVNLDADKNTGVAKFSDGSYVEFKE